MKFSTQLDRAFLRKSYARRIFHNHRALLLSCISTPLAAFSIAGAQLNPWTVSSLSAVAFVVLVYSAVWFRQSKALDSWLRQQGNEPVHYTILEDSIETSSAIGSARLKWSAFKRITLTNFDTLLYFQQGGTLSLPTALIPGEALELLKEHFNVNGKKVEDIRRTV